MKKVIPFSKTVHFKTMIAEVTDIEVKHTLEITGDHTIEGDILVDGTYKMTEASQIEEEFHYTLPFTIEVDDKYDIQSADIGIHDFYFEILNEEDLKVNVELEISQVEEKVTEELEDEILIEDVEMENVNEEENLEVAGARSDIKTEAVDVSNEDKSFLELEQVPKKVELLSHITKEDIQPLESETDSKIPTSMVLESSTKEMKTETVESEIIQDKTTNQVSSIFSSINQEETFVTYHVYIVREQDTLESILEKYQTTKEAISDYNDLSDLKVGNKIIIPCYSNE